MSWWIDDDFLQPLSVEGSVGINLSLGVSGLTLTYVPR